MINETKKAVVIGASNEAIHAIKKAQELGLYVYALDGNADAEGLRYADESIVIDISDRDKVSDEIEKISPDFLLPVPVGRILAIAGYINDKFKLKGINFKAAENSTDKYKFHNILKEAGLRDIDCFLVNKNHFEKDIKFPSIMKPRFGSGSRNVIFVNNDKELKAANMFLKTIEEDFVLEQMFGGGEEYSLDGAVVEGKLFITLIRKKEITPLPNRQAISSYAIDYDNEIYKIVYDKIINAVEALNYDDCLIHVDMIINKDGVNIIEMAPRPSGHSMHSVFVPYATGVDMIAEFIKYLTGDEYCFKGDAVKTMKMVFFDFEKCIVEKIPDKKYLMGKYPLKEWNCLIKEGDIMECVTDGKSIMGRGYFIIDENETIELDKIDQAIKNEFVIRKIEL